MTPRSWFWAGAGVALLGLVAAGPVWEWNAFPRRAEPGRPAPAGPQPEADGTTRAGAGLRFERAGVRAARLAGSDWEMGVAEAMLFPRESAVLDEERLARLARFAPARLSRWVEMRWLLLSRAGWTRDWMSAELARVSGFVAGSANRHPLHGFPWPRGLIAASAPELAPWTSAGGLAFGVSAQAAAEGGPLLAGSLQAPGAEACQASQLVRFTAGGGGPDVLSLAWPGLAGETSGLNSAGLGVVLLPARGSGRPAPGVPATLLVRRVLRGARTLEEAERILRAGRLSSPAIFVLGSGPQNAFRIVEKTADRTAARDPDDRVFACGDYFETPELAAEAGSLAYRQSGLPEARTRRLHHLLDAARGRLDPPVAVGLLRDRRGPNGEYLGLGHPQAIDALEAIAGVVYDLRTRTAWVCAGPDVLGEFVPFSLGPTARAAAETVPADPLLSGPYADYRRYRERLALAQRCVAARRFREALSELEEARPLNPADYRAPLLAGRALAALGHADEARYNYEQARNAWPATVAEKAEVARALKRLREE